MNTRQKLLLTTIVLHKSMTNYLHNNLQPFLLGARLPFSLWTPLCFVSFLKIEVYSIYILIYFEHGGITSFLKKRIEMYKPCHQPFRLSFACPSHIPNVDSSSLIQRFFSQGTVNMSTFSPDSDSKNVHVRLF